jgi:hypothetical protein
MSALLSLAAGLLAVSSPRSEATLGEVALGPPPRLRRYSPLRGEKRAGGGAS